MTKIRKPTTITRKKIGLPPPEPPAPPPPEKPPPPPPPPPPKPGRAAAGCCEQRHESGNAHAAHASAIQSPGRAVGGEKGGRSLTRSGGQRGVPFSAMEALPPRPTGPAATDSPAGAPTHLTAADRVELLRTMLLMRAIEARALALYRQGRVPGSFYDGFGQEAVSVGAAFAMGPRDRLCILHRDLGAHLVRGVEPPRILAQYMGRASGVTGGRDGNVHFGDPALGCVPMVSMLPDMMCVAAGMAMAFKLRGEPRVRADVLRRRLDVARRLPRGDELGRRAAAAGRVRAREQPVRLLDAAVEAVRRRPGAARARLRLPRGDGGRQRRRGGVRGSARRARAGAGRRGPDASRGRDDAHARPRRARRHALRAARAAGGVGAARPDRAPGAAHRRARRGRGHAARGGRGRGRRGRRGGAGSADARPSDARRTASSRTARRSRSATGARPGAGSPRRRAPDARR